MPRATATVRKRTILLDASDDDEALAESGANVVALSDSSSSSEASSGDSDGSEDSGSESSVDDSPLPAPKLVPARAKRRRAAPATSESAPPALPAPPTLAPLVVPAGPHMRLRTTAVKQFNIVIGTLAPNILTEAIVVFNENGMYLSGLDDAKTVMVDWRVLVSSMEGRYSCNHNYRVRVDMEQFVENIKNNKSMEVLELALDGELPEDIVATFSSEDMSRQIRMRLMQDDGEDEVIQVDRLQYQHSLSMRSQRFRNSISSINKNIPHVRFTYKVDHRNKETPRQLNIYSHTQLAHCTTSFKLPPPPPSDDQQQPPLTAADDVELEYWFSLQRIERFVRVTNATTFVQIFPADMREGQPKKPMRISYEVAALGVLSFYVGNVIAD